MYPVDYVLFVFGGPVALSDALKISHSAVSQWRASQRIPSKRQNQILTIARTRGLDINPKDLIEGRNV